MKKRIIPLILAILLLCQIMAGCNSSPDNSDPSDASPSVSETKNPNEATANGEAAIGATFGNASAQAGDVPEMPYADGVPLKGNVVPAVVIQGSDYDMGYQYSMQIKEIFGSWVLERLQRELTDAELAALKEYQAYIDEYTPEFIEMFKGMADGATAAGVEVTYAQVLADYCIAMLSDSVQTFPGTESAENQEQELPIRECSGFAAWGSATKDGKLIAAGSGDHPLTYEFLVVVLPEDGNSYIYRNGFPSYSFHPAMNNKGLCYVHHGEVIMGDAEGGYGVPTCMMLQHTMRYANNSAEALEMQMSYPTTQLMGGLFVDTSGDAFDIHCREPETVRRPGDNGEEDFIYVANNVLSEELGKYIEHIYEGWEATWVPHGGFRWMEGDSVWRNLGMWNMLHNYHGEVDLEFAKMMWRFAGNPPAYDTLEEADIGMMETQGRGWDPKICHLDNGVVGIMIPEDGDGGRYLACYGYASDNANPLVEGLHSYGIDLTHTFYELQLASTPADIMRASMNRAQYDLWYAHVALRELTVWDTPYAAMKAKFDEAVTEWEKGDYYAALAAGTTGNESVGWYAKAIRCYNSCQAYAQQLTESLNPPADSPDDLGLREYGGSWAEWETWMDSK